MIIKNLRAEHFRNLDNVSVNLGSITVFVGKVGAGKSNIIDAFRFMRDAVTTGLDHALGARGGIESVRQFARTRPYVLSLSYEFASDSTESGIDSSYSMRLDAVKDTPRVKDEAAKWGEPDRFRRQAPSGAKNVFATGQIPVSLTRDDRGNATIDDQAYTLGFDIDELILGGYPNELRPHTSSEDITEEEALEIFDRAFQLLPFAEPLANHFRSMRFVSIYPNVLREPMRIETGARLQEDCANWASVLRRMKRSRSGTRLLNHILEMMRRALPELTGININNAGGYLVPQFRVQRPGGGEVLHDPIHMSDGTLRLFGILLALYAEPKPTMIAIEEPEQTIHPGLLKILVDAIQEASAGTQILLTTHSPYLLDHFSVEQIRVVEKRESGVTVGLVRKEQVEAVKKGLMHISELMALDGLQGE